MSTSGITITTLRRIFPKIDTAYVDPINQTFIRYQITTEKRQAAFLAQAGHESAYFMRFSENLNYSAAGLTATFGRYFSAASANAAARNPQKIANIVYANRMGNGSPGSGDGWLFRGRGAIQLTGRETYTAFARDVKLDMNAAIRYLETPMGAVISAGWFWARTRLNPLADESQMTVITKRINGGTKGLDDRLRLYKLAMAVL